MGTLNKTNVYLCQYFAEFFFQKANTADGICRQNHKTRFIFNNFVFENHTVCEIKWNSQTGNIKCALHAGYIRL